LLLRDRTLALAGDGRMVGEGADPLDLRVGEWPTLLTVDDDGADQLIFLEHWHRQTRPSPGSVHCRDAQRIAIEIGLFGFQVGNVDHPLGTRETAETGRCTSGEWATV